MQALHKGVSECIIILSCQYILKSRVKVYQVISHDMGFMPNLDFVLQILIQKDIFKIPVNNIVKRWTKKAKEGFEGVHIPSQSSRATDDSAARQNILYIAAMEAVKEVS